MTLSIGSGQKEFLMAQRNQLMFKPVFLKQFLYWNLWISSWRFFEIGEKGRLRKRYHWGTQTRMSTKSVSRYKKLLTTQVENLLAVSHLIQHKTFSALSYAQDFGNRVKGSLKRTTSSTFTEMSNCPMPNAFMPLLALSTMSLPSVRTMTKKMKLGWGWTGERTFHLFTVKL